MASTTRPVVDARFCAPHATAFTVTKKVRWPARNMTVTVADGGAPVMQVEGDVWCWPRRSLLLDAASRHPVITVKRCPSLLPVTRRWEAFMGESTSPTDLLFATVARPSMFGTDEVYVHLAAGNPRFRERRVDYVVVCRGQVGRECTVCRRSSGGAAVAKINRTSELPVYRVTVNPHADRAFILALTVILEEIRVDETLRQGIRN